MKVIRAIFSLLFFLVGMGGGAAAYYLFVLTDTKLVYRLPFGEGIRVPLDMASVAVTVVMLLLALIVFPKLNFKSKKKVRTDGDSESLAEIKAALKSGPAFERKETPSDSPTKFDVAPPEPSNAAAEDDDAMARLIVIDQGEMSHEVVLGLCKEFFPDLSGIMDRIDSKDNKTLETLGKHIIGIGRNMLKLKDKKLSDNQFAIFQERCFKAEHEEFLRLYQPENLSILSDEQRPYIGTIVDKRSWENLQRIVRGQRADWVDISLSNVKEYL